jgi:predicted nucleotidyltransferase
VTDTILLQGIVGSTAYGLSTPESDVDRLGIYAAPTEKFHGLHPPVGKHASKVTTHPDITLHEVGKFAGLALGGNPTILELLWLPSYEVKTLTGESAVEIRQSFLSAKRVRDAYFGYATQQFHRLKNRGDGSFSADTRKRTAKHARHLRRLLLQGFFLYRDGVLPIKLDNPTVEIIREFGERVALGDIDLAERTIASYSDNFSSVKPAIPERPDEETVDRWLRRVRFARWREEVAPGNF